MSDRKRRRIRQMLTLLYGHAAGIVSVRIIITVIVVIGFYASQSWQSYQLQIVSYVALTASYAAVLLTSDRIRRRIHHNSFVGEWEYVNLPESEAQDSITNQLEDRTRHVEIYRDGGELVFKGWLEGDPSELIFNSKKTILNNFGRRAGDIIYFYKSPAGAPVERRFYGLVYLEWQREDSFSEIASMSGIYYGETSRSIGRVRYVRRTAT